MEVLNSTETKDGLAEPVNTRRVVGLLPMFLLIVIVFLRISWSLYKSFGQKTRSPQQRRMYVGSRAQPSLSQPEPTIYVSPANLPPPPKYEAMAPPSYEEVVGIHYPNYQIQPITQPITTALAQDATNSIPNSSNETAPSTVITVTAEERRTSVTVARS